jgi:hypothetical protein
MPKMHWACLHTCLHVKHLTCDQIKNWLLAFSTNRDLRCNLINRIRCFFLELLGNKLIIWALANRLVMSPFVAPELRMQWISAHKTGVDGAGCCCCFRAWMEGCHSCVLDGKSIGVTSQLWRNTRSRNRHIPSFFPTTRSVRALLSYYLHRIIRFFDTKTRLLSLMSATTLLRRAGQS